MKLSPTANVDDIVERRCPKCGKTKNIEYFHKNKSNKHGYSTHCKLCNSLYNLLNKGRISEYHKNHYQSNKDKIIEQYKARYKVDRDKIKAYRIATKDRRNKYNKEYQMTNKDKLKDYRYSPCKYDSIGKDKLKLYEEVKSSEDNYIMVKCAYCGGWFKPKIKEINKRLSVLNGTSQGDQRFYCSQGCKKACPIFHKSKHPKGFRPNTSREVQPELRQMVLERDNYRCQICHKVQLEVELHCHHITGVVQNPIESADVDNCITLCKEHHKWVHSKDGCNYNDLKCKVLREEI